MVVCEEKDCINYGLFPEFVDGATPLSSYILNNAFRCCICKRADVDNLRTTAMLALLGEL